MIRPTKIPHFKVIHVGYHNDKERGKKYLQKNGIHKGLVRRESQTRPMEFYRNKPTIVKVLPNDSRIRLNLR